MPPFVTQENHLKMSNEDTESGNSNIFNSEKIDGYTNWRGRPARKAKHGGWKAARFMFGVQVFQSAAVAPIAVNLVTYLFFVMHFPLAAAATTVTNFAGVATVLSLVGGFVSDSFLNRFWTMIIFGFFEILGFVLLAGQAHFKSLQPAPCNVLDPAAVCEKADGLQSGVFFFCIYLAALGGAGTKSNVPSHGGDQFDEHNPVERHEMSSFFNWLFFSICFGVVIGLTIIVWVQNDVGHDLGFFLSGVSLFIAWICLILGASKFRNKIPEGSPFTRIAQVFLLSFRKRRLVLPSDPEELHEISEKEAIANGHILMKHTDQFRFLDKAAIVDDGEESEKGDTAWEICTRTQVEEVKFMIRVMPIFASTIMLNCTMAQLQTFSVAQGSTTNNAIGKHFRIPAASLPAVSALVMLMVLPLYDKVFVPVAKRITGHESGITSLQRIGVGLALSIVTMQVAAVVEIKRKHVAEEHNILEEPQAVVPLSILWMAPQYLVFGMSELFTYVGLMEFYYSQSPPGMRSLASSLSFISMACGYLLSSVLVSIVNNITSGPHRLGWLAGNNLNLNKLDYFYWLLSILCILSLLHFLFWASWYKYKEVNEEVKRHTQSIIQDKSLQTSHTLDGFRSPLSPP